MKALFVVFHGFAAHSGISKKIFAQCEALNRSGVETRLCYIRIEADGRQLRMIGNGSAGDLAVSDFGRGPKAKIVKRLCFADVTRYIRHEGIDLLYVRHDHNANPALIRWFSTLKKIGVKIALEIPTYPYDREFDHSPLPRKLKLAVDKCFRRTLAHRVDRVVTFSDHPAIFGRPTIRLSNGVDFASIPLKKQLHDTSRQLHMVGVANIHVWHGFDRVIEGMKNYYAAPRAREVVFHIVGDGIPSLIESYRQAAEQSGLGERVVLHGPLSGAALDDLFQVCDLGIASLARHRSGISSLKSLKNREYAARGIPFVYSERDDDFEQMPYVMKAPADESPLDIEALLRFADSVRMSPAEIRASVETTLSWEHQMKRAVDALNNLTH